MSAVNKAIIPAAGLGKRMQPLSGYLPKPMLPLGRKPVLRHIVEEIRAAGIKEILILTRSEHQAVFDYFEDKSNITIKVDDSAGGPGQAVLEGREFAGDENFLVVFSDAPLEGGHREQVVREMAKTFEKNSADASLSIYPVPEKEATSRGIVRIEEIAEACQAVKITDIIEKPDHIRISNPWASACRYILTSEIFDALDNAEPDESGELQLTAGIKVLLERDRKVLGVPLPDGIRRHDTGNFKGYFKALANFTSIEA